MNRWIIALGLLVAPVTVNAGYSAYANAIVELRDTNSNVLAGDSAATTKENVEAKVEKTLLQGVNPRTGLSYHFWGTASASVSGSGVSPMANYLFGSDLSDGDLPAGTPAILRVNATATFTDSVHYITDDPSRTTRFRVSSDFAPVPAGGSLVVTLFVASREFRWGFTESGKIEVTTPELRLSEVVRSSFTLMGSVIADVDVRKGTKATAAAGPVMMDLASGRGLLGLTIETVKGPQIDYVGESGISYNAPEPACLCLFAAVVVLGGRTCRNR